MAADYKRILKKDNLNNKLKDAEETIVNYGATVSAKDAEYGRVVNSYQEEITEMEQSLEAAVDFMAECLADRVPDTEAIDELNRKFNSLEIDLDSTLNVQLDLDRLQENMEDDLAALTEQVKEVQDKKSSRQEVKDALDTKADVSELNGKLPREQFAAIYGELENNISVSYDKFNNQESFWQKCIDDLDLESRQKPHKLQLKSLRLDILDKLSILMDRLNVMIEISSAYSHDTTMEPRQLMRTDDCLSCKTEALRPAEQPIKKASIKPDKYESSISVRKQSIVKTIVESDGGGDTKPPVCYLTGKVEHPVAQRTKDMRKCKRICGERFRRPDFPIDIKKLRREYILSQKPCVACNPPPPVRKPSLKGRARRLEVAKSVILQKAEAEVMEEGLVEEEQLPEVRSVGSLEKFFKYSMYFGPDPEFTDENSETDLDKQLNEGDEQVNATKTSIRQGTTLEGKPSVRLVKLDDKPTE